MTYLIDGYNLLFFWEPAAQRTISGPLASARNRLLTWLARKHPDPGSVLVIFDAREAERGDDTERELHGVRVRFSTGRNADDLLEDLIRDFPHPARLTVISNDHRLQRAGQRRGARVWGCGEFLDWLEDGPQPPTTPPPPPPEKPESVTPEEVEYWLKRFGANP